MSENRGANGKFIKGNTCGGRRKQSPEFRETVLKNAPRALQVVMDIMNDPEATNADRLKAASIVIERAYGKPEANVRMDAKFVQGDFELKITGEEDQHAADTT